MVDQGCNAAHQCSSEAEQRSSKADESSRLRSFRRDLKRASFFLVSNLFRLIVPALAIPTPTVTTTASSTNAAPSATSSAGADRDSSFQVFADGTQDIAALVGIFATDSVEKYAIDYSKGYLAPAVASLSLLGLLGYVRLLVKIALGADGCRKAGFDMKALRPMFGVQDEEYVPTDAVHQVCYMRRKKSEGQVHWSFEKIIKHTEESFQLLKVSPESKAKDLKIVGISLDGPQHVFLSPLLSILCSALTCFPIMIFEPPLRHQSWTYYYATVGLFCSIVISTMTWMWVHIQEQHPHGFSDWTVAELFDWSPTYRYSTKLRKASNSGYEQVISKTSSLDLKDTFAFSRAGTGFHIYDVSITEIKVRKALRASSFLLSVSILIGYACQYIEVRRLSAIKSGYWLLIQGALAVIRVVVWVWHPSWDDSQVLSESYRWPSSGRPWNYDLTETRLVVLWASLQTEGPTWLSYAYRLNPPTSAQLSIPNWALPAFRPRNQNPERMFELARKLRRDNIEWDESLQVLQNAEDSWDMPPYLFTAWVFAWPNSDSSCFESSTKGFSCRIIREKQSENGEQRLHFLPCGSDIHWYSIPNEDGVKKLFNPLVFGVPYNRNRCVFALDEVPNLYPQQKLVVGCDTPMPGSSSATAADVFDTQEMFEKIDTMWKNLDPILKATRNQPPTPSSPTAPIEPHTPTDLVRTRQQASPAGSAIELATLPCADEGTQPDADIIGPQARRSTSNYQNPSNAHSP